MPGQPDADPSALRQALDTIKLPLSSEARGPLRETVFDYVDALKAAGRPPEHVILAVKKLAFGEARHLLGAIEALHLTLGGGREEQVAAIGL